MTKRSVAAFIGRPEGQEHRAKAVLLPLRLVGAAVRESAGALDDLVLAIAGSLSDGAFLGVEPEVLGYAMESLRCGYHWRMRVDLLSACDRLVAPLPSEQEESGNSEPNTEGPAASTMAKEQAAARERARAGSEAEDDGVSMEAEDEPPSLEELLAALGQVPSIGLLDRNR